MVIPLIALVVVIVVVVIYTIMQAGKKKDTGNK